MTNLFECHNKSFRLPSFAETYFQVESITEPLKNISSVVVLERKNIAPMKTGALICYEATLVLSEGTGPQFFLPAFRPDSCYINWHVQISSTVLSEFKKIAPFCSTFSSQLAGKNKVQIFWTLWNTINRKYFCIKWTLAPSKALKDTLI